MEDIETLESRAVLVVEDDSTLVRAITRNLEARGYQTAAVAGVEDAVEILHRGVPSLLLVDIDLPDGSGWDVVRWLRTQGFTTPVIVISALRPNERLIRELGCRSFLEKPFPIEALVRQVEDSRPSPFHSCTSQRATEPL